MNLLLLILVTTIILIFSRFEGRPFFFCVVLGVVAASDRLANAAKTEVSEPSWTNISRGRTLGF